MLTTQIMGTLLLIAFACLISGASFPPSKPVLQVLIDGLWFWTGFIIGKIWTG